MYLHAYVYAICRDSLRYSWHASLNNLTFIYLIVFEISTCPVFKISTADR